MAALLAGGADATIRDNGQYADDACGMLFTPAARARAAGWTALNVAILHGSRAAVRLLVEAGVSVEGVDVCGYDFSKYADDGDVDAIKGDPPPRPRAFVSAVVRCAAVRRAVGCYGVNPSCSRGRGSRGQDQGGRGTKSERGG